MSIFFFKQKTAYEMRISDWSSDVCSSDLRTAVAAIVRIGIGAAQILPRKRMIGGIGGGVAEADEVEHVAHRVARQRLDGGELRALRVDVMVGTEIGRASGRERVCLYV